MKCPVCATVDLLMSERQGVEIDYCPQCRGVWLDRGELDKIIERSSIIEVSSESKKHDNYIQHGGKHHSKESVYKHKKKSFLDDFFDF